MASVLVISSDNRLAAELTGHLEKAGISLRLASSLTPSSLEAVDLVIVDITNLTEGTPAWAPPDDFTGRPPLVVALVPRNLLSRIVADPSLDDFVLKPPSSDEVVARVQRLLNRRQQDLGAVIHAGDLVIDTGRGEVTLAGKLLEMTFREYELLRFLAANKGRLFTRAVLLDKVWGFDYLGGDRTVDVHVRRLRSKIEDQSHSFIDTVRNIGYRFRKNV